jgi:hypothetical protein
MSYLLSLLVFLSASAFAQDHGAAKEDPSDTEVIAPVRNPFVSLEGVMRKGLVYWNEIEQKLGSKMTYASLQAGSKIKHVDSSNFDSTIAASKGLTVVKLGFNQTCGPCRRVEAYMNAFQDYPVLAGRESHNYFSLEQYPPHAGAKQDAVFTRYVTMDGDAGVPKILFFYNGKPIPHCEIKDGKVVNVKSDNPEIHGSPANSKEFADLIVQMRDKGKLLFGK